MKSIRTYSAYLLLILFCCYYSSISLFFHAHIVGGVSVVHSHFGGDSDHSHSDSQYAVIDILSQFQSETPVDSYDAAYPFYLIYDNITDYYECSHVCDVVGFNSLRGPPQVC